MRGRWRKTAPVIIVAVGLVVGFAAQAVISNRFARAQRGPLEPRMLFYDAQGGAELYISLHDRNLYLKPAGTETLTPMGLRARSALFLPDGSIIFVSMDLGLYKLTPQGTSETLLGPKSANAPLFLHPSGRWAAYLKPLDFLEDDPFTNGIAVFDLKTRRESVLLVRKGDSISLFGWLGLDLIIKLPPQGPATTLPWNRLTMDGQILPSPGLSDVPVASGFPYPVTSPDQRFIAVALPGRVMLLEPASGERIEIPGAADPWWAARGLEATVGDKRQIVFPLQGGGR